jgi:hypothetical protein
MKTLQLEIYTQIFIAPLFVIANRWKQSKFPLTNKWINKMHGHALAYHLTMRHNEMLINATVWMDLRNVTLSE